MIFEELIALYLIVNSKKVPHPGIEPGPPE